MKRFALLFFLALAALAQTGTVDVTTTIVATAGASGDPTQVVCTGTPGTVAGVSTMHMVCVSGGKTILTSDATVPSAPATGILYSVSHGQNSVTWLLSKGNPIPDQWQVAANGVMKSGRF